MRNANTEVVSKAPVGPNPKRVVAGRLNRGKRKGLTPEGRERLRRAAHDNKPWLFSTGPLTPAGKATAAANGKKRQSGLVSARELRADLQKLRVMLKDMAETRRSVEC
ncbi:unnamed protein product [Gemmataceae bacterium]|nr:unnamed protein product [Gemmataceae bacterium]VTT98780.1 unnamed protein product [Gemmataceae bacterium]